MEQAGRRREAVWVVVVAAVQQQSLVAQQQSLGLRLGLRLGLGLGLGLGLRAPPLFVPQLTQVREHHHWDPTLSVGGSQHTGTTPTVGS